MIVWGSGWLIGVVLVAIAKQDYESEAGNLRRYWRGSMSCGLAYRYLRQAADTAHDWPGLAEPMTGGFFCGRGA